MIEIVDRQKGSTNFLFNPCKNMTIFLIEISIILGLVPLFLFV